MTASKYVGKPLLIVLAGLLSTPPVTAEQRERTLANTSDPSSKSEKLSSAAKESPSKETKRTPDKRLPSSAVSRVLKLQSGKQNADPGPAIQVEEKGDTIVFGTTHSAVRKAG